MSFKPASLFPREAERKQELDSYDLLDTEPESTFDNLTWLAAYICQTPSALITLVDSERQWFKSTFGWEGKEGPRDLSFCAHAILQPEEMFVVADARNDERVNDHPGVLAGDVAYYAGSPLVTPSGFPLGTLCIVDRVPRALSVEQLNALRVLAKEVVTQMDLRRTRHRLETEIARLRLHR